MVAKASYAVTSWKNDNIISIWFDRRELHGDAEDEAFNRGKSVLDAEHELLPVQGTELQNYSVGISVQIKHYQDCDRTSQSDLGPHLYKQ